MNSRIIKRCKSTNKNQERCSNNSFPFSKYCLYHQDYPTKELLIAIFIALCFFLWQERKPDLHAFYYTINNSNPSELQCEIKNTGFGNAKDIYVSFTGILPDDTRVIAEPEIGAKLIKSDSILDPNIYPRQSKIHRVFSIYIPRVLGHNSVNFIVKTMHSKNIKAAEQTIKMRKYTISRLEEFQKMLKENHRKDFNLLQFETVIKAIKKTENFYNPNKISYNKEIKEVNYLDEDELFAKSLISDLLAKYKNKITKREKEPIFQAPVLQVETSTGKALMAIHSRYINTTNRFKLTESQFEEFKKIFKQ